MDELFDDIVDDGASSSEEEVEVELCRRQGAPKNDRNRIYGVAVSDIDMQGVWSSALPNETPIISHAHAATITGRVLRSTQSPERPF